MAPGLELTVSGTGDARLESCEAGSEDARIGEVERADGVVACGGAAPKFCTIGAFGSNAGHRKPLHQHHSHPPHQYQTHLPPSGPKASVAQEAERHHLPS